MKIALVHDYLTQLGGAERVLGALARAYPDATIYTLLYDRGKVGGYLVGRDVQSSFLNKLPKFLRLNKRLLLPFLPKAIESLDLSEYDLIISSSSAFAKGAIKNPKAVHICYCHSPARFLWDYKDEYQKDNRFGVLASFFANLIIPRLQKWDKASADRVDFWIANSKTTQERIKKYYGKNSVVIYPPLADFQYLETNPLNIADYFFISARLSAYKKIDIVIEAFNDLGWSLAIAGEGPERKRLEKMAGGNIKFLGFVPDKELGGYYASSKAFILANEEDFGLSALEAASFGKPVLAYKKGGATEWLEEGITGEFFESQTKEAVIEVLRKMAARDFSYNSERSKDIARNFNEELFQKNIIGFISSCLVKS